MVPCQVCSSSLPVMAAPGRHFATCSGSVRNLHTSSAEAGTTNVLTMSNAMAIASGREEAEGICEELLAAARIAEEVFAALVGRAVAGGRDLDLHAADPRKQFSEKEL